jgi:peptidyl-tRNA hydrolase
MPDANRVADASIALLRRQGMSRGQAAALICDVAIQAAVIVTEQTDLPASWLWQVSNRAAAQLPTGQRAPRLAPAPRSCESAESDTQRRPLLADR